MSNLVAIVYPDAHRAAEVMATLGRLQNQYLIDLADACVVTKDEKGKLKLQQAVNLTAIGAISGAFWGTLVGLLFFNPLLGTAVGAAAGAISGKVSDCGIDDDFIKALAAEMQPNSSAIFALVRQVTLDKVEPEIAKFGGKLLYSSLSKEGEQRIQTLLDTAAKAA